MNARQDLISKTEDRLNELHDMLDIERHAQAWVVATPGLAMPMRFEIDPTTRRVLSAKVTNVENATRLTHAQAVDLAPSCKNGHGEPCVAMSIAQVIKRQILDSETMIDQLTIEP